MDVVVDLVTGILMEVVASAGTGAVGFTGVVGTGWASTLTLYFLLVSKVFFILSLALGPGWVGHGWVCC